MKCFAELFVTEDGVNVGSMTVPGWFLSYDEVHRCVQSELTVFQGASGCQAVIRCTAGCSKSTTNAQDLGKPAVVVPGLFSTEWAAWAFMAEKRMRQALECSKKAGGGT